LESRFPGVSRERCREELHLVDERGLIFAGAAAVRETLARLPGAPAMTLPFRAPGGMWMADRIYRWIARNRGWLSRWRD
jgi:predicted DCC family thiol-disulfide oxidoreductase YuxK